MNLTADQTRARRIQRYKKHVSSLIRDLFRVKLSVLHLGDQKVTWKKLVYIYIHIDIYILYICRLWLWATIRMLWNFDLFWICGLMAQGVCILNLSNQLKPLEHEQLHPGKLTLKPKITHVQRKIIFQTFIIVFHVNFEGCTEFMLTLFHEPPL